MIAVRRFLESLMGVKPVAPGEDTQWRLRFNLGWPDWVVFLFILASLAFVGWVYWSDARGTSRKLRVGFVSLRLFIIGLILLMIGQLELAIDRTGLPYLTILVDDSESMQVRDVAQRGRSAGVRALTRMEAVDEFLSQNAGLPLIQLTAKQKLQLYSQSSSLRLLGTYLNKEEVPNLLETVRKLKPTGTETKIGANVRSVINDLRGTPPSAIVLFSDGVTTQGESLSQVSEYAARKNIPLFTVGTGDSESPTDIELTDLLVDDVVFADDDVTFEATLKTKGIPEGTDIKLTLRQAGNPQPLDEKTYKTTTADQIIRGRLTHRPTEAGEITFTLDTPTVDREINKENNRIERHIRVLKEKVKVLYVEAYPRYEYRFIKHLLERQPSIDVSVLLLDADPEYIKQDQFSVGSFPTEKKDLFAYDVVLWGDVRPGVLTSVQLNLLKDFVKTKGGGLLFIAGENADPASFRESTLAELLPIEIGSNATVRDSASASDGFSPVLTPDGKSSPIFRFAADDQENEKIWNSFPPIYWYSAARRAKPGAQVFVEHPTERTSAGPVPLVATQFFGAGRTMFQAFDSTWRWRKRQEDLYHARYWIQTIRFLSRSKLLGQNRAVELTSDRREYRRGDPVLIRVRFLDESQAPRSDDGVSVLLEQEGRERKTLQLRRLANRKDTFETIFSQSDIGKYRAKLYSPVIQGPPSQIEFNVLPPPGELEQTRMNEAELRLAAEKTKGKYLRIAEAGDLWDSLPIGQRVAIHSDSPIPLWNSWPVLAMFIAALVAEWLLRKKYSLL